MPYKLAFTQKPTYLHAVVTGLNKPDTVKRYLERVRRECQARRCFRVLIEERLEGPRLGTMDVFQIVADESGRSQGFFRALAYVDVNAEGDSMKFAETVAVNRGIPVRVFTSVGAAEQWLLSKERGSAPPDTPADADHRAG
jgi:hypothetical protein